MKNLENDSEIYVKAIVYGPTGTGKTSLAATAPRPLVLLSERQGLLHLREAAARLGVAPPVALLMEDIADYRAVFRAANGDPEKPFTIVTDDGEVAYDGPWPETLVVDSLTDACRLIVSDIRKTAKPKEGKDGLPVDSERFWNVLGDRCQNLILSFRNMPMNVLFLAHADDRMVGEENPVRSVTPDLPMRKLAAFVAGACNVVAYSYRYEKHGGPNGPERKYALMFSGPEYMMLKSCGALRAREHSSFERIIDGALKGIVEREETETPENTDIAEAKMGPAPAVRKKPNANV